RTVIVVPGRACRWSTPTNWYVLPPATSTRQPPSRSRNSTRPVSDVTPIPSPGSVPGVWPGADGWPPDPPGAGGDAGDGLAGPVGAPVGAPVSGPLLSGWGAPAQPASRDSSRTAPAARRKTLIPVGRYRVRSGSTALPTATRHALRL